MPSNYQQFPMTYAPYPYPQIPIQMQPQQAQQSSRNNPPIQNTGFILIRSEDEVYRYPVAPGNCVTFKVENEPIVIEKSMSFSQLDAPKIDRYRLVREDIVEEPRLIEQVPIEQSHDDGLREDIEAMRLDIEDIKKMLYNGNQKNNVKKNGESKDE